MDRVPGGRWDELAARGGGEIDNVVRKHRPRVTSSLVKLDSIRDFSSSFTFLFSCLSSFCARLSSLDRAESVPSWNTDGGAQNATSLLGYRGKRYEAQCYRRLASGLFKKARHRRLWSPRRVVTMDITNTSAVTSIPLKTTTLLMARHSPR